MVTKQCDLCKCNVSKLHTLHSDYETYDVKELCGHCVGKIDKIIFIERDKYLKERVKAVKQFFEDSKKQI